MENTNGQLIKLGALWKRTPKKEGGQTFLGGEITIADKKTQVIIFKNGFKSENPNAPDYIIYQGSEMNQIKKPAAVKPKTKAKVAPTPEPELEDEPDAEPELV